MSKPFKGVINLDVRESTPDWGRYEQPKAAPGSPNVLFIVWDDTGFGALEPFGGPIRVPNMTDDYPNRRPWAFSGGTIKQVIVDVTGEPYRDLEKEALAMMSRD